MIIKTNIFQLVILLKPNLEMKTFKLLECVHEKNELGQDENKLLETIELIISTLLNDRFQRFNV